MKRKGWVKVGTGVAVTGAGLALFSRWQGARAERQVPPDGRFVDLDGARLHYLDIGEGSPVVLVHGLGGQLRNFTYALADRLAPHHRLLIVDRPRSGYSIMLAGAEPGIAAQAQLIAQFIEKLELKRPLLVGHSLGGALSLALALDRPGLVSGLALIAPMTQPQAKAPVAFRGLSAGGTSRAGRALVAHMLAAPLARVTSAATLRQVFAPEPVPADFAVRGGGALSLRPAAIAAAMFEMGQANAEMTAIAARYGELSLPVSILFAREDKVLDHHRNALDTARDIAGCRVELVDGGHMLPVTQPEVTAAFIERAATAR